MNLENSEKTLTQNLRGLNNRTLAQEFSLSTLNTYTNFMKELLVYLQFVGMVLADDRWLTIMELSARALY